MARLVKQAKADLLECIKRERGADGRACWVRLGTAVFTRAGDVQSVYTEIEFERPDDVEGWHEITPTTPRDAAAAVTHREDR